jgi:hypothetical protein
MVSQIESDRAKRAGNVAQVEEHLPTNYKVLSSNPSTTKKKEDSDALIPEPTMLYCF